MNVEKSIASSKKNVLPMADTSGMGPTMNGHENDRRIDDTVSDFTKDPAFQHIISTELLMTESRKKEIFQRAMLQHPTAQDEFNSEYIDHEESSIGVWQWRLKDGRLIWSPGMFRVMGRDPELGAPTYEEVHLKFIDGTEKDKYLTQMQPVMEGNADSAYFTVICVRPGGDQYFTSGVTLPIKDEKGNVVELCGYLKDHDATKRLCGGGKQMNTSEIEDDRVLEIARKERIMHQKALTDKNNFIAYVFHEVRNPMNAVYLGLQTLLEEIEDPDLKEVVELMQHSTERAVAILNDTLDYSKFELGTVHLNKTLVPISEFVEKCAKEHKAQAQQLNISITVEKGHDSVCKIDASRMMQVMNNLFSNAMKFTPADGHITVKYDHIPENKTTISVSDSGIGIREDDQERIFTPYNQIDNPVSAKKGMGIGLSISRKIVNAHYGDLTVQSNTERGSKFTVTLPAIKRIEIMDSVESKLRRLPGQLNGLRVLVVDDDAINRIMMGKILKRHGCVVGTMKDGAEFLDWTRDPSYAEYDLVMLDDFMPRLDGSGAIKIARKEGFEGWVIMLTGNMQKSLDDCGANTVMHKPLKFHDLVGYIESNSI